MSSPKGVQPTSSIPPFSYSGGKRQLASRIVSLCRREFPNEYHLISPFLGAAAAELRFMFARRGSCLGADADRELINLWKHLIVDARAVADTAQSLMPLDRETWYQWYRDMMSSEWHTLEHAAKFYLLRYTRVLHAWNWWAERAENFNQPKTYRAALARVAQFKAPRLTVEHADFRDFLSANSGIVYCDSPYVSDDLSYERVYERRGTDNVFTMEDHAALADLLSKRKGWIASNSNHPWVWKRYQDYHIMEVPISYNSHQAQRKRARQTELLILNPL